jgi:hypothetical protein
MTPDVISSVIGDLVATMEVCEGRLLEVVVHFL